MSQTSFFMEKEKIKRTIDSIKPQISVFPHSVGEVYIRPGQCTNPAAALASPGEFTEYNTKTGRWGGKDVYYTFMLHTVIPAQLEGLPAAITVTTGRERAWNALNPQFIVYMNGVLKQALDTNHTEILLSEKAYAGDAYDIVLEGWSGMEDADCTFVPVLYGIRRDVEGLYYDLTVGYEAAILLEETDVRRVDMLTSMCAACDLLDLREPGSDAYYRSIASATAFMKKDFYGRFSGSDITLHAIGHTHIDVAWLWTLSHTRKKAARSFSTVLELMNQYPEYLFSSSQPQLYQFVKRDYPELYAKIKDRVAEGRFEAEGAMWLEADCNLTSGESLVRQILFGKRFFKEEFGVDNRILWLPDVFGYSAALPQIMKKCGVDYFVTSKISWNEYNRMPNDTFMWQGIDGTEVLTHFHTMPNVNQAKDRWFSTYNGQLLPDTVAGAWRNYKNKDISKDILASYGYGDGGGGPTREMLEYARRLKNGLPGVPAVYLDRETDFCKTLEKNVRGQKRLPKWVGELYLELHRGTYTSNAGNKRCNRKSELSYQNAEFVSAFADKALSRDQYPRKALNDGWECILLNQFHDIIPGSSIKEVYDESRIQYKGILTKADELTFAASGAIAASVNAASAGVLLFNQTGHTRSDAAIIDLPAGVTALTDGNGNASPVQDIGGGKGVFFARGIPACGYKTFYYGYGEAPKSSAVTCAPARLSNRYFTVTFDKNANIRSIYDKNSHREVLKGGVKGNTITAYEDKPGSDAWDINLYYQDKAYPINEVSSVRVLESGPVRACVEIVRPFLKSTIRQTVIMYADMPRIDFKTEIDWKETHLLLKAAFPVDVHAERAAYDIQFGNVERPTHWNTSWDIGKFEVCAHKWADLSESDYGVSLLNDCKYGHDIKDGVIRLTLLKSANSPNVASDREMHYFTYSLLPHAGGWREGGTVDAAYALNCPLYACPVAAQRGILPAELSLVSASASHVMIDTVKKAEDGSDLIVRLYEYENRRGKVTLSCFKPALHAYECNLLEENESEIDCAKGISFEMKPYEIKTIRLVTD